MQRPQRRKTTQTGSRKLQKTSRESTRANNRPCRRLCGEELKGGTADNQWRPVDGVYDENKRGAAGTNLFRMIDPEYADGIKEPSGPNRPSARLISNELFAQDEDKPSKHGLSDFLVHFGQLLAHDTDHTTPQANVINSENFRFPSPKTKIQSLTRAQISALYSRSNDRPAHQTIRLNAAEGQS